jgi:endonuclease V-like protein UPF0215 family
LRRLVTSVDAYSGLPEPVRVPWLVR